MHDRESLRTKADLLRSLHVKGRPLVLANVWDCATARVLEDAGAPAIATTSAGIAFAQGYPDGQQISRERMLEMVARIAASVSVPVTADMEAGYGSSAEDLAETIRGLLDAGAVGLNLEDHVGRREDPLVDLPTQLAKLRAVRQAAERAGIPVVVNARTDPYLRGIGSASEKLD